ncbi:MAG: alpha/beta hydrolase [Halovenus sp.]
MPVVDNDGVGIAYEVINPSFEETVVLVGGLGYGRWFWQWQRPALEDAYSLVIPDHRGVGDSDTPEGPYTIREMANDLEAVLADIGIESAHVFGVSMGGMVAQQYAVEYDRAESLILLATDCGGEDRVDIPPEVVERILNPPEGLSLRENIRYEASVHEFWEREQEVIEEILDYRTADPVSDQVRTWQAEAVGSWDLADDIERITQPTLLMHGERDQVVPVENLDRLVEGIPHAEIVRFDEGGSHLFAIERSKAVNERIRAFLDDR